MDRPEQTPGKANTEAHFGWPQRLHDAVSTAHRRVTGILEAEHPTGERNGFLIGLLPPESHVGEITQWPGRLNAANRAMVSRLYKLTDAAIGEQSDYTITRGGVVIEEGTITPVGKNSRFRERIVGMSTDEEEFVPGHTELMLELNTPSDFPPQP